MLAPYRLSIQLHLNGLSFITEESAAQVTHWQYIPLKLVENDYNEWQKGVEEVFAQEPLLRSPYQVCTFQVDTPRYTWVPTPLFDASQAAALLRDLFALDSLDEVHFEHHPQLGATCIYAVPSALTNGVWAYQGAATFRASVLPLLDYMCRCESYSKALLAYTPTHVHLILMQGAQLLLCNAYPIDKFTTALYYLFFALKQWQMNAHSLSLYITGGLKPTHLKLLTQYFPSIEVVTAPFVFALESLNLQYGALALE